jgi:hypothetical protein
MSRKVEDVGKRVGGALYIHKDALPLLGDGVIVVALSKDALVCVQAPAFKANEKTTFDKVKDEASDLSHAQVTNSGGRSRKLDAGDHTGAFSSLDDPMRRVHSLHREA